MDYVEEVGTIIGPPSGPGVPAECWRELEAELRVELPSDFKALAERYAPMQIGRSIWLQSPATTAHNLAVYMRETVAAYQDCGFSDENFPEFPVAPGFGAPDGLIPITPTTHGESVFLARSDTAYGWCVVVFVGDYDEFYRYDLTFSEWFYRYLRGDDMAGPGGGQDFSNPIALRDFHVPPGTAPVERFGPVRGS
ncbi:SMI1/KNR4 family protein [Streptomyces kaniharaensis]|uniref:SMI1/KNR4 family protein n=1 Tax=Streptomyces kaniharaensis TaxID=212423 RepID=A0A6N7KY14_9ACTN|nr:SMI1/KNR4 family protein [Streptomyces kaniharaensis]MQS16391.1 SMI1/KNR4 family protein [Streptomyces kaniharaensis]